MRLALFVTFLVSLAKGGLWITIGTLVKNHFETFIAFIIRKPVADGLIDKNRYDALINVIKWIGIFIIIIGIGIAVLGLVTFIIGFRMPTNSFNFNF